MAANIFLINTGVLGFTFQGATAIFGYLPPDVCNG